MAFNGTNQLICQSHSKMTDLVTKSAEGHGQNDDEKPVLYSNHWKNLARQDLRFFLQLLVFHHNLHIDKFAFAHGRKFPRQLTPRLNRCYELLHWNFISSQSFQLTKQQRLVKTHRVCKQICNPGHLL